MNAEEFLKLAAARESGGTVLPAQNRPHRRSRSMRLISASVSAAASTSELLVAVKRVTYVGMPTQEVWRHRVGFDPDYGTRIDVRVHEIYAWSRQVAYAILIDVLGHKLRARKLASDFGGRIENQIYRPYWLLTETDIQSGIFEVERTNDLRWIPSLLCYAGKGKALDLSPEAQLCRASNHESSI